MLSGKELFKYRQGLDKTIPQRGGDKDYMPDGSWLQDKKLENFNIERQSVLSEQRVQREGDLVKGEWKPERKLVEFQKEMRNFWEHMGFMDRLRKWLYPEEALFLMETNVLEVWYNGLPLSISEGYMMFLDTTLTLEYYQVFAHLRRIGFVVLRHQGRKHITKYEQQIGLDKIYLSRKERKTLRRKKEGKDDVDKKNITDDSSSQIHGRETVSDALNMGDDARSVGFEDDSLKVKEGLKDKTDDYSVINVTEQSGGQNFMEGLKEPIGDKDKERRVNSKNAVKVDKSYSTEVFVDDTDGQTGQDMSGNIEGRIEMDTSNAYSHCLEYEQHGNASSKVVEEDQKSNSVTAFSSIRDSSIKRKSTNGEKNSVGNGTKTSLWNFDEIIFPDFGIQEPVIVLCQPNKILTPDNLETSNSVYKFDRDTVINKNKDKKKTRKQEAEWNGNLKYSYSMMTEEFTKSIKSCKNWQEYKEEKARHRQLWKRKKEFSHLFKDIEPLVRPELATSTAAVLEQLQIIQEEPKDSPKSTDIPNSLPHFDVYKPDTKFRKSSPGMPDHRVVVAKCSDSMPELSTVHSITSYLQDNVPLKWAVVETGNIAFYDVSQFSLPIDITFG